MCTLIVEIHLAPKLQMNSSADLRRMATFWQALVVRGGFRFWYVHSNPGPASGQAFAELRHIWHPGRGGELPMQPAVNPLLRELGADGDTCCYEIGLHREECAWGG